MKISFTSFPVGSGEIFILNAKDKNLKSAQVTGGAVGEQVVDQEVRGLKPCTTVFVGEKISCEIGKKKISPLKTVNLIKINRFHRIKRYERFAVKKHFLPSIQRNSNVTSTDPSP